MPAPKTETRIWMAMRRRVETLPHLIVWPGQVEMPTGEHVRVTQIIGEPQNDDLGARKPILRRTLQLLLHTPLTAKAAYEVTQERGAQIAAAFPQGHGAEMTFDGVRVVVTELPLVVEGYRDEQWWITPVRVRTTAHI